MRAWLAIAIVAVASFAGCGLLPGEREAERLAEVLGSQPNVVQVEVSCIDDILATSKLCATVELRDGTVMQFFGAGDASVGPDATRVVLARIGSVIPAVLTCDPRGARDERGNAVPLEGTLVADIHRTGVFGDHFSPPIADTLDAIARHEELRAAFARWPRCPQAWTFTNSAGVRYSYCAAEDDAVATAPDSNDCR